MFLAWDFFYHLMVKYTIFCSKENSPKEKSLYIIMQNTNIENIYNGVTDSEKSLSSSDEKPLKRPVGKPRTAMWRLEGEKYNKNPVSATYKKDFYHEKLAIKVVCEFCGSTVNKQKLKCERQL